MEIKKSPKADLQNRRIIFLLVGLVIALGITGLAFSINSKPEAGEYKPPKRETTEMEQIDNTRQDQPETPPEQQKAQAQVVTDVLNIVTNDEKIETGFDFAEFDEDVEIVQQVAVEEEEIEEDQPFVKVEEMPSFQGGDLQTFRNWVQSKVRYPQIAQENNISGRVFLMFVVERDGTLTNIQVLQSPDSSLSDEAVRVLKTSPKWKPGKQRNQTVRVKYTLPIDFRIQN